MKKFISYFIVMAVVSVLSSCASSKSTSTVLNGTDLSKYKYVVLATSGDGDAELEDIGHAESLEVIKTYSNGDVQMITTSS